MKNIRRFLSDSSMMGCANLVLLLGAFSGVEAISTVSVMLMVVLCVCYSYLLIARDIEK